MIPVSDMKPLKMVRAMRLDSMPLNATYFTEEGYLVDHPILTSVGIFDYTNDDGSLRRELRLPEEVFNPESLKTYKGKPVIITHDAGLITKDNVEQEGIGTILSEGYRDGNDVRAELIIHDTDAMKQAGLKELSLGYNLELDETPGIWNGQHYDAIQRNISINHVALVLKARAGDQARLNIDSKDKKGATRMNRKKRTNRADGVLSPEELKKAIEEYKKRRGATVSKDDTTEEQKPAAPAAPAKTVAPAAPTVDAEQAVQQVKDNKQERTAQGAPKTNAQVTDVINQQDEDMDTLFDIIDTLLAERDMKAQTDEKDERIRNTNLKAADPIGDSEDTEELLKMEENTDEDDTEDDFTNEDEDEDDFTDEDTNEDEDEDNEEINVDDDDEDCDVNTDSDSRIHWESPNPEVRNNMDSADAIDRIVRQRVQMSKVGAKLGLVGLESMSHRDAKKAVIRAVAPSMRLDGKSDAYIDGAFNSAVETVNRRHRKDTNYQRKQMFNRDSANARVERKTSATAARERMIKRMSKKEDK